MVQQMHKRKRGSENRHRPISGSKERVLRIDAELVVNGGQNVGTYAIVQDSFTAGSNYTLTYVGTNLTITKRPIAVTADPQTKVYGNADPALTYKTTSGSLVSGDAYSGSLTRAGGETVAGSPYASFP